MKNFRISKKHLIISAIIILIILTLFFVFKEKKASDTQYEFTEITKGSIETTISCTGTLNPVNKVEVGTQVSGIVNKVLVDYNQKVHKNEILAVIDTSMLALEVQNSEAILIKAKAQYDMSEREYQNSKTLFDSQHISELDLEKQRLDKENANSSYISAKIGLEKAQRNLKYAVIYSPINGTVIDKNVEEGQTVAASLSSPTLFVIAKDLSKMEIQAYVDESDIGSIKQGQAVRFTVDAHPENKFEGVVRQVRLLPATVQNVVNYTVVIDAENKDEILLPGMTATVDFIIDQKSDILMAPNTALKFMPSEDIMVKFREKIKKQWQANKLDSSQRMAFKERAGQQPNSEWNAGDHKRQRPKDMTMLWYLDSKNEIMGARIQTGITDGKNTEIVRGRNIEEGMKIITGLKSNAKTASTSTNRTSTTTENPMGGGFGGGPPRF